MKIEEFRNKIDNIDDELVLLLKERLSVASEIDVSFSRAVHPLKYIINIILPHHLNWFHCSVLLL